MGNVIFYFSGTGNSLSLARDIAAKMGDTKVLPIAGAIRDGNTPLPYDRVGFVFPVYFASVPEIVSRFIGKLKFEKTQYIFGVATFGGMAGMALSQLNRLVSERGGTLNAGFSAAMPGNYINKYGAFPQIIQRSLLKGAKKKAARIAAAVKERRDVRIPKVSAVSKHYMEPSRKILAEFGNMAKDYHATDKCTACGTCERICPVGNIKMENGRPVWGNECQQCVACIQWCPAQAIEYADKTAGRKHYHHPEVRISDINS